MEILKLSKNWQLFLDDHIIQRATGITCKIHQPAKKGPVIKPDELWEVDCHFGMPVTYYNGRFHLVYTQIWPDVRKAISAIGVDHNYKPEQAYAASTDGIHWEKPVLRYMDAPVFKKEQGKTVMTGVDFELLGYTRDNNCGIPVSFVYDMQFHSNVADPQKRFIVGVYDENCNERQELMKRPNIRLYFSTCYPDFISDPDWKEKLTPISDPKACAMPRNHESVLIWDDIHDEWVCFNQNKPRRTPEHKDWATSMYDYADAEANSGVNWMPGRHIDRWSSKDLVNWMVQPALFADSFDNHSIEHYDEFMDMRTIRCEDFLLGFMTVFHTDRSSAVYRGKARNVILKGTTETQLATSRDGGLTWKRAGNRVPWLPHGPEEDSFDRLVMWGHPVHVGDENWFYHQVANGDHTTITCDKNGKEEPYIRCRTLVDCLGLAVQRWNGYVSMSTGTIPEILYTKAVVFEGNGLYLNADCSRGEIRVEITYAELMEDEDSGNWVKCKYIDIQRERTAEGRSFGECQPVLGDSVNQKVIWNNGADLSFLAGKPARLRFYIRNADLYGFKIV